MRWTLLPLLLAATPAAAQNFGVTEETLNPLPDMSAPAEELPQLEIIDGQIVVEDLSPDEIETGIEVEELSVGQGASETLSRPRQAPIVRVAAAQGAVLRGLDKVSGNVVDMDLGLGEEARLGRLTVSLTECRYPAENPSGDAYAFVRVTADGMDGPAFEGWMIASSPALSALDHPRYDVWVIRCNSA